MKRVKIVSNGTPQNTHVIDADTGEEIYVTRVEWSVEAKHLAKAVLYIENVELDVEVDAEVVSL